MKHTYHITILLGILILLSSASVVLLYNQSDYHKQSLADKADTQHRTVQEKIWLKQFGVSDNESYQWIERQRKSIALSKELEARDSGGN